MSSSLPQWANTAADHALAWSSAAISEAMKWSSNAVPTKISKDAHLPMVLLTTFTMLTTTYFMFFHTNNTTASETSDSFKKEDEEKDQVDTPPSSGTMEKGHGSKLVDQAIEYVTPEQYLYLGRDASRNEEHNRAISLYTQAIKAFEKRNDSVTDRASIIATYRARAKTCMQVFAHHLALDDLNEVVKLELASNVRNAESFGDRKLVKRALNDLEGAAIDELAQVECLKGTQEHRSWKEVTQMNSQQHANHDLGQMLKLVVERAVQNQERTTRDRHRELPNTRQLYQFYRSFDVLPRHDSKSDDQSPDSMTCSNRYERGKAYLITAQENQDHQKYQQSFQYILKSLIDLTTGDPEYICARLEEGTYFHLQLNFKMATRAYKEVLELAASSQEHSALHMIAHVRQAGLAFDQDKVDLAFECLDEALALDPRSHIVYYHRAQFHERCGEFCQAMEDYQQAISCNPEFALAYLKLGQACIMHQKGSIAKGLKYIQQAIELESLTTSTTKNPEEQEQDTKVKPRMNLLPEMYEALGQGYRLSCEWAKAESLYNEALEREPHLASAYVEKGMLCQAQARESSQAGHEQQAMTYFHYAMTLSPEYLPTYLCLARSCAERQEYLQAIRYLEQGIQVRKRTT